MEINEHHLHNIQQYLQLFHLNYEQFIFTSLNAKM